MFEQTDWFDHEKERKRWQEKGAHIRPPQIQPRRDNFIDLTQHQEKEKPQIQKQKLVPQKPKFYKINNPDINVLRFNENFKLDLLYIPDGLAVSQKMQPVQKFDSSEFLSENFNYYTKLEPRKKLYASLQKASELQDLKERLQKCNQFQLLNEDNLFANKQSLKYAQLQSKIPFLQKSNVDSNYFALLVDDSNSIAALGEFIIYNLIQKQKLDVDPYLFCLPLDGQEIPISKVGKLLKETEEQDFSVFYQNIKEEVSGEFTQKRINEKQINQIHKLIEKETDFGVMLYYGGSKISNKSVYNEKLYTIHLLQHITIGLQNLQHLGTMILKTQYLVCTGFKQKKQPEVEKIIKLLSDLYKKALEMVNSGAQSIQIETLIEPKILENELKLRIYIQNANDNIVIFREQALKYVIDDIQPSEDLLSEIKIHYLAQWGLIEPKERPQSMMINTSQRGSSSDTRNQPMTQRPGTFKYQYAPQLQQQQPDQVEYKHISEEEQARLQKIQDRTAAEFLSSIEKKDQRKKQELKEKQLEKQRILEQKKLKELEELEAKKEALKAKLQKDLNPKKKTEAKKPSSQTQKEGSSAVIEGNKIAIPMNPNLSQPDQEAPRMKKREVKEEEKKKPDQSVASKTKSPIKPQDQKIQIPMQKEQLTGKRKHILDEESESMKPKKRVRQVDDDENMESEKAIQLQKEEEQKRILEKIEKNKREQQERMKQQAKPDLSVLSKDEEEPEEFSTLMNLLNGDISYNESKRRIATGFRKPSMAGLIRRRNDKKAQSPVESPRMENASPRTKIISFLNKNKTKNEEETNDKSLKMTTKVNFENDPDSSPRRHEPYQNSFFRRVFCMSPKQQSTANLQTSPKNNVKEESSLKQTEEEQKTKEEEPKQKNKKDLSFNTYQRQQSFEKCSSALVLKLQPVEMLSSIHESQEFYQRTLTRSQSQQTQNDKELNKSGKKVPPLNIVRSIEKKEDLWSLVAKAIQGLSSSNNNKKDQRDRSNEEEQNNPLDSLEQELKLRQSQEIEQISNFVIEQPIDKDQLNPIEKTHDKVLTDSQHIQIESQNMMILDHAAANENYEQHDNLQNIVQQYREEKPKSNQVTPLELNDRLTKHFFDKKQSLTVQNASIEIDKRSFNVDQEDHPYIEENFIEKLQQNRKKLLVANIGNSFSTSRNGTDNNNRAKTKLEAILAGQALNKGRLFSQYTSRNKNHSLVSATENRPKTKNQAAIQSIKISNILEKTKKKTKKTLDSELFHNSESNYRSRSVNKAVGDYGSSPYQSAKLLPLIKNQSYRNEAQSQFNMSTDIDDTMLQVALDKYLPSEAKYSSHSGVSSQKRQNLHNQTLDQQSLNNSLSEMSHHNNFEEDMKKDIQSLQDHIRNTQIQFGQVDLSQEPTVFVSIVNLMMKHPIFRKMSKQNVKRIISSLSYLMILKKNQVVYKEEEENFTVYIPVYGTLSLWSKRQGQLGRVYPGFTAGEESICDKNYFCRLETCFAEAESTLLCIDREAWFAIRNQNHKDPTFSRDLGLLDQTFSRNFIMKKGWKSGGITKLIQGKRIKEYLSSTFVDL